MDISEFNKYLENIAPRNLSADWDNTGWQIEISDLEVNSILLSIDVRPAIIEEALKKGANLILSHHPLLFSTIKAIDTNSIRGRVIKKAIENNIAIFSAHTNLDVIMDGTSFVLAKIIGLQDIKFLVPTKIHSRFKTGWGAMGRLKIPVSLEKLSERVSQVLKTNLVIPLNSNKNNNYSIVAVGAGSMSDRIPDAIRENASVYITSDVNYHEAQDAVEAGLSLIIVDHFYAELPTLYRLKELLEKDINVPIMVSEIITSPFGFVA